MDLTFEPSRLSMTSRVLLGLLLLANLVLALYLYFAEPSAVREGERYDRYVPEQSLRLISELDPSELIPTLKQAIAHDGPTLIDIISQPLQRLSDEARSAMAG